MLVLSLPNEVAERLAGAGIPAEYWDRYAAAVITAALDQKEVEAWWDSLTEEERQAEVEKTDASVAAAADGRVFSAEEVYARIRARHPVPAAKAA